MRVDVTPDQLLTVRMRFGAGNLYTVLIEDFDLLNAQGQETLPPTLKLGFAGATGLSTNHHDVRLLKIAKPANLSVTIDDEVAVLNSGSEITYTIEMTNDGPNDVEDAVVSAEMPEELDNVEWECVREDGSNCGNGAGNDIDTTVDIADQEVVTFVVTAVVSPAAEGGAMSASVSVAPSEEFLDGDDTDDVQTAETVVFSDPDGDGIENNADLDDDNDGIPDTEEGTGDTDGDGVPNYLDLDSDNDGIVDIVEAGGTDADQDGRLDTFLDADGNGFDDGVDASPLDDSDSDADGDKDRLDIDSDNDGIVDNIEALPSGADYPPPLDLDSDSDGLDDAYDVDHGGEFIVPVNTDGDALPDYLDDDSDGDGVPDLLEGHDSDTNGIADRTPTGSDSDADGLDDAFDTVSTPGAGNSVGSNSPLQNTDNAGDPDWRDLDDDGDTIPTSAEDLNGNLDPTDDDSDTDGTPNYLDNDDRDADGVPDEFDLDDDNDGIPDVDEPAGDSDGDGLPDRFDLDSDGDGLPDLREAGGADADGDGRVDGFVDANGDGLDDSVAASPLTPPDSDSDSLPDYLDIDSDGDGIVDAVELQDEGAGFVTPSGVDVDADGFDDAYDPTEGGLAIDPRNTDGDATPDYLDDDSDADGVPDSTEGHDDNSDGDPDRVPIGSDSDGDGLDDAFDTVVVPGAGNALGGNSTPDTDVDGDSDWRDTDDDGDGTPTIDEDRDNNGDPTNDDVDLDGTPDYLEGDQSDIIFLKSTSVDDPSHLEAGDEITYTLEVTVEDGNPIVSTIALDSIPANTTYVPNSTTLNGNAVSDVGGISPIISGLLVNSDGDATGTVTVGGTATISFRVTIDAGVVPGTVISNQAVLSTSIQGVGELPIIASDNPDSASPEDQTVFTVGEAPVLEVSKSVSDENDGFVEVGDTLSYDVRVSNLGNAAATDVVLSDQIPNGVSFLPGSLRYDADGLGGSIVLSDDADGDVGDFDVTEDGTVTLAHGTLDAGAQFVLRFQVTVDAGLSDGFVISNQAVVVSNEQADENSDQDGDDENGDQPTDVVVGSSPFLRVTKKATDVNGGSTAAGETIEYEILVSNLGSATADNVVITDGLVTELTSYVPGSTFRGPVLLADANGTSPLAVGLTLGSLESGEEVLIRYRVTISDDAENGDIIDVQAQFSADGLSGVSDSDLDDEIELGNDPDDPQDDDVTRVTVGGVPGVATVSGLVFFDKNHDRVVGDLEKRFNAWIVELAIGETRVARTRSGVDGSYLFTGVPPGDEYIVRYRHPETNVTFGATRPYSFEAGERRDDVHLPVDPTGVVYDSIDRTLIEGAIVQLSGPVGFDPDEHLLPGQQNQITAGDGMYCFQLLVGAPSGFYSIDVLPPSGEYSFPSTTLAPRPNRLNLGPTLSLVTESHEQPELGDDNANYFLSLQFESGDETLANNHLPLDQIAANEGALHVIKRTPRRDVSRADLVPYVIEIENLEAFPLAEITTST
ncbi:MAG: isopeptide-forming domain-containing fimbrial protein [Planctomycetota bacterium]